MEEDPQTLNKIPRDRGWAWVVLLAAWLNNIMVSGIYKTFGILFIEIQTKFNSTSAKTSLVYSLLNASFSCTSLFIAIVDLKSISVRQCISFGTSLACCGYLLAAFVPTVDLLVVGLGVGLGVGQGFIYAPQMALIGQYFDKRKGLANCVALTGGSVGSLILPYLIGMFVDSYGLSGTMLLLAALNFNGIVFAALMRPFPMKLYNNLRGRTEHSDKREVTKPSDEGQDTDSMLDKTTELKQFPETDDVKNQRTDNHVNSKLTTTPQFLHSPHLQRSIGGITRTSLYGSSEFSVPSLENVNLNTDKNGEVNIDVMYPGTTWDKVKSKLKSVLDLNVLKIPVFLYYMPFAVLIANGASMYLSFLLPHAKDVGLSGPQIKSLMTLMGIADVITIPLWGVLADRQYLRSNKLVAIAMICIAIPACFVTYFQTYEAILAFSAIYGVFGRVYFSLSPVILVEFLGLEYLRSSVGISLVIQAIFHSIMLPLVGLMRDEYGTYNHSYQMMGVYLLVGAAGILIMPELAIKLHGQPQKRREYIVE